MTEKQGPIEQLHGVEMGRRQAALNRMRSISQLVDPGLMPSNVGGNTDEQLPQLRQHVGPYGLQGLRGKILDLLYPLTERPLRMTLDEDAKFSGHPPESIANAQRFLDRNTGILLDRMMSSAAKSGQNRTGIAGFRASKSTAIDYSVGLGECLQYLDRNFQNHVFRPDFYSCQRDGLGNVLATTVQRTFDALSLDDDVIVKADIPRDLLDIHKPADARKVKMTTLYRWEQGVRRWVARDEIRGVEVHGEEHRAPRYYITPWRLRSTEQVGRSMFETIYALLKQLDIFSHALRENVAIDADVKVGIDQTSNLRPRDIASSGVLEGVRIIDGKIADIGAMSIDKSRTIRELRAETRLLVQDLYRILLIEQDMYPQQDRVTREQILRVAAQVESMSGGTFSSYAEYEHVQTFAAAIDIAETDGLFVLPPDGSPEAKLIDDYNNVRITTGAAAIAQGRRLGRILEGVQALTIELPPIIDQRAYAAEVVSLAGLPENIIKTPEAMEAERQQAMLDLAQAQAIQTGVQTTGAIIERQAQGM